jgi:hypothetical protein
VRLRVDRAGLESAASQSLGRGTVQDSNFARAAASVIGHDRRTDALADHLAAPSRREVIGYSNRDAIAVAQFCSVATSVNCFMDGGVSQKIRRAFAPAPNSVRSRDHLESEGRRINPSFLASGLRLRGCIIEAV